MGSRQARPRPPARLDGPSVSPSMRRRRRARSSGRGRVSGPRGRSRPRKWECLSGVGFRGRPLGCGGYRCRRSSWSAGCSSSRSPKRTWYRNAPRAPAGRVRRRVEPRRISLPERGRRGSHRGRRRTVCRGRAPRSWPGADGARRRGARRRAPLQTSLKNAQTTRLRRRSATWTWLDVGGPRGRCRRVVHAMVVVVASWHHMMCG